MGEVTSIREKHFTKAGVGGGGGLTYVDRLYNRVYIHKNIHPAESLNVCNSLNLTCFHLHSSNTYIFHER